MSSLFGELAIVMVLVFFVSIAANRFKQPLLIGYIITGILAGPLFLNVLSSAEGYEAYAHIGVSLLLFIVGLHLNVKLIKEVGLIALITGVGQILFTALFGYAINMLLGYSTTTSILLAAALTFSSTIVIIKMLADNHGIDKLYGRISVGVLLVQDLVAVLLLMIVGALQNAGGESLSISLFKTTILGIIMSIAVFVVAKTVLPNLLKKISEAKELLFIFIISWCFGVSALFELIGFSLEIGALMAGVALASSQYQHDINSKIKPLRDFFIVMFFIFLGSQLIPTVPVSITTFAGKMAFFWSTLKPILIHAILLSVFVLLIKPILIFILVTKANYSSKTAFTAGLTLSQISEFSLILLLLATQTGLIGSQAITLITLVALITITASAYLIVHADRLYKKASPFLRKFERKKVKDSLQKIQAKPHEILIFGCNRIGLGIIDAIKKTNKEFLIIDHDPKIIQKMNKKNIPCMYGDATNIEFISEFNMRHLSLLISTVDDFSASSLLLEKAKSENKNLTIVLSASKIDEALELYDRGAHYVILPHFLGSHYVSTLIEEFDGDTERFFKEKILHLTELKKRKILGHEHPDS